MEYKKVKVLKIKTDEFLSEILEGGRGIKTTNTIQKAMDVSEFSWEQISHLVSNLHKVGYTEAKVVDHLRKGE